MFFKKGFLKNFAIFTGKQHRCFPVSIAKNLRTAFFSVMGEVVWSEPSYFVSYGKLNFNVIGNKIVKTGDTS